MSRLSTRSESEPQMSNLYRIAFTGLHCDTTTDEWSSHDEPYALFLVVDLQDKIPVSKVFHTKVFQGVDDDSPDNSYRQHVRFWGINGAAHAITHPDKVFVLVALMESDESDLKTVMYYSRSAVDSMLLAFASHHDMSHARRVTILRHTFATGINLGINADVDDGDDGIGLITELAIQQADLDQAHKQTVNKTLVFEGPNGDKGKYELNFQIAAGAGA